MPLVTSTPLFEHARKNRYAVPAFNANSYEMIPALIHAAEAERSPLILQIGKKIFELRSRRRGGQLSAVPGKKKRRFPSASTWITGPIWLWPGPA